MARFSLWKCFIPIWCIVDGVVSNKEKQKQQAAAAAAAAELAAYQDQCEYEFQLDERIFTRATCSCFRYTAFDRHES